MTRTDSEVTVVEISDLREIPIGRNRDFCGSTRRIQTEAEARAWAIENDVLTVYWHKGIDAAFGYVGK